MSWCLGVVAPKLNVNDQFIIRVTFLIEQTLTIRFLF